VARFNPGGIQSLSGYRSGLKSCGVMLPSAALTMGSTCSAGTFPRTNQFLTAPLVTPMACAMRVRPISLIFCIPKYGNDLFLLSREYVTNRFNTWDLFCVICDGYG